MFLELKNRLKSVSYTHLDVYKRQTYNSSSHIVTNTDDNISMELYKLTSTELAYKYNLTNQDMGSGVTFTGTMILNLVKK